jgi:hypothetical protein
MKESVMDIELAIKPPRHENRVVKVYEEAAASSRDPPAGKFEVLVRTSRAT